MFNNLKTKYPYPILTLPHLFRSAVRMKVDDESFKALYTAIEDASKHKDFLVASSLAQKAAVLYGVPGLILYNKTIIPIIETCKGQGETVQTQAINALSILYFTQLLIEKDKERVKTDIMSNLPEIDLEDHGEFKKLEHQLIKLGELDDNLINQCHITAEQMIEMTFGSNFNSTFKT